MSAAARAAVSILAAMCSVAAWAQQNSATSANQVQVSGRIVSSAGKAVPNLQVTLRKLSETSFPDQQLTTNPGGVFAGNLAQGAEYQIYVNVTGLLSLEIGTFEIVQGNRLNLGNIELRSPSPGKFTVSLAGPVQIEGLPHASYTDHGAPSSTEALAAIYIVCDRVPDESCQGGGKPHILLGDGREVLPPPEKDQVGTSHASISQNGRVTGWLVDYDNCCTSYPLSLQLDIYRPGKPLLKLSGDGRAIFGWHFLGGGKQVAFYQSFPHGDPAAHYELHEVQSGRLLEKWDDPDDSDSDGDQPQEPAWVETFDAAP